MVIWILDYLIEQVGMDMKDVIHMLNKESGLLGVSGVSSDFRDVLNAANEGERAKLEIIFSLDELLLISEDILLL